MKEKEGKRRININKIKILAILPSHQELQGQLYSAKLFSSDRDGERWLYSGIEVLLALIIDHNLKTKYICLFDPANYQKCFQYELYKNFEKYFYSLAPEFLSFEIDSGFIGLQFEKEKDALNFERVIKRITAMGNELFNRAFIKENSKLQNEIASKYAKKLKELFSEGESRYDDNYAEDGIHISKHRNFQVLNNIKYDNNTKQFKFGRISPELKDMFLSFGIKKKDLENNMDFVFTLFKKVIVGLGTEKKLKNPTLEGIEHNFCPPKEREKRRREEEAVEAKLNSKRSFKKKKFPAKQKPKQKSKGGKSESIPIPPPPPPAAYLPHFVPRVDNPNNTIKTKVSKPEVDVATQVKNINLKKIEKVDAKEENKENNMEDNGKNVLQELLSRAIIIRNNYLHMHDDEEEQEDDDW